MKNSIELAIFDMAGTTVNENNVVYKTVQKVLTEAGYHVPLEIVLELGAGKEKRNAIHDILQIIHDKTTSSLEIDYLFNTFKKELKQAYNALEITSYNGVEDLFEYLRSRGIKVVLNTGYDESTARKLIKKLGWEIGKNIDDLITADDVATGRPSAEMIHLAMKRFSIDDPSKVLKAGDSIVDIEEGKNACCGITIGVLTGAQTRKQLQTAQPTLILENLAELKNIL
ncbi:phosphonatase-like hydrolase [Ascidiimonas aurantiaca]|uniref:phosphonatase-like hydrolase n=1 Tax=Ascidiimonas aurantiaca TaxID=1685432 RepID=UPI0030EF08D3